MYYAIMIELDHDNIVQSWGNNWANAYEEITLFMRNRGFVKRNNGLYVNDKANNVDCVVTIQELADYSRWFSGCLREARLLRIEEDSNLRPAINHVKRMTKQV